MADNQHIHYVDRQDLTAPFQQNTQEIVAGAFGEYTYAVPDETWVVVAGLRADHNSRFGWFATPRLNVKYMPKEWITFRISAGRGLRSPQVLPENMGLMVSSKRLNLTEVGRIGQEKAWNVGGNVAFTLPLWNGQTTTLSLDYFYTRFQNQVVVDMERHSQTVFFYASNGRKAEAHALQADLSATLFQGLELFAALRYNQNRQTYTDGQKSITQEQPLVASLRGLVNLSYATARRRWVFDATAQLNGRTRLPSQNGYATAKEYAPAFPIFLAQITRNSKRFDVYWGGENLLNYKQKNPIQGWDNPFGANFDASRVWGPVSGIRLYLGMRLRIGKLY